MLLRAYAIGVFPMSDSRDAPEVFWVEPRRRAVIPIEGFRLSRSLRRTLRADAFTVTADRAFEGVIRACADRQETWINSQIEESFVTLHRLGHAHSVECWQDGELVGGLYGVSLGAAFFGESMFSRVTDASKVALVHLVARLRLGRYRLLDTQFLTPHLAQFGAIEISRARYHRVLAEALRYRGVFPRDLPGGGAGAGGAGAGGGSDPLAGLHANRLTS
jgi:leucyl/phenylalanyl-tRNA--protein transferase